MKKRIVILAVLMAIMLITSLVFAACEQSGGSQKKKGSGTYDLKVWCAEEDMEMINNMLYEYEQLEENEDNKYNWTVQPVGEKDAGPRVSRDTSTSADVFSFASDQLGNLVIKNAILPVPSMYHDQIDEQIMVAQNAATFNGEYYAYPYTYENCFLYYNKSMLNESQVQSLETLVTATISASGLETNLAIDMTDAYYTTAFLYTAGVDIFGPDGLDVDSVDLDNEKAKKACRYIESLSAYSKFASIGAADQLQAFQNGKVAAIISGPHDIAEFKGALGKNFAVAKLPTIKFQGDSNPTQMTCFGGVKLYGVNRSSKEPEEAAKLAAFLSNAENQDIRLADRSFCPTDSELFDLARSSGYDEVEVVIAQSDYSKLKPAFTEMAGYWDLMGPFLYGVYTKDQKENNWSTRLIEVENKLKEKAN